MIAVVVLAALLANPVAAQFSLPATVELDIITPQPDAVYKNPTESFPVTFVIQHDNIAETYGYSFGWTLRSNYSAPGHYSEGASIGFSPALMPKSTTIQVWQSVTNISNIQRSRANGQREFLTDWYFHFQCNATQQGDQVVTSPITNRNASGTFRFYTRPDADVLPRIDIGGSTGQCADLLQTIPINQNLTAQFGQRCPELGPLGSDNSTAKPCAINYQGQTVSGTQVNLAPISTSGLSASSSSTPTNVPVTITTTSPNAASSTMSISSSTQPQPQPASTTSSRAAAETVVARGSTGMIALALGLGSLLI